MTVGDGGLLASLCLFVFSMLLGIGGWFRALIRQEYGWQFVGIGVAVNVANCVSLIIYFLH